MRAKTNILAALTVLIILTTMSGTAMAALVGWWKLDDSGTTAADSSGNGYNGTLVGNATIVTDAERGKVLWLDGAGDYVDLGNGNWTNPGNHMTIAAWIKVDAFTDAYQTIIAKGLYTYRLGRGSGNKLDAYMDYDASHNWKVASGTTAVNVGWHHAAVTYDGTTMKIYIDGVQEGSSTLSALNTNTESLMIGRCYNNNSRDWQGWIDDVRFYNTALTSTEILALVATTQYTISGSVGTLDGVTMGGLPGSPVTSGGGSYTATVNAGWGGTVTPTLAGYIFNPANMTYSNVTANQTNQNYSVQSNLIGSWTFDEDNTNDSSGNGYNGALVGNASLAYDEEREYVLSLDGNGDYMNIAGCKGVTGTGSRTTCAWIKTNANDGTIISWGTDSAGAKWHLKIDPDSAAYPNVIRQGVSGGYVTGTTQLADGQWHHVATVLSSDGSPNATEVKIYVDGIEEAYTVLSDEPINTGNTYDVRIGCWMTGEYFNGLIDDVKIYNIALTPQEIRVLANLYDNSENDPNIVGCWKFDDVRGNIALDSSLNHYDGTIVGAAPVNGKIGQALDFVKADVDYVTIPAEVFSGITNEITIALWQYGSDLEPLASSIFYGSDASGNNRILNAHLPWNTGHIIFDAGFSGTSYDRVDKIADSASQYKGQWNHWAFTKNAATGEMKTYFNGQLWSSGTGKTRSMSGITQFKIGSKTDGTSNYDGLIDEFRIYNKELSTTEIQKLAGVNSYVGFWSFDDGGPNDVSGNDRHGILMGDAHIVNDAERGNVLSLDGYGDYMNLGNGAWTNLGNNLTIAAWVKADFDSPYHTIIAKGNETYRLSRYGVTSNSIGFYTNADQNSIGETNVNDGQWHHVAATYDSWFMKLYIDGIQQPDIVSLSALNSNTDPLWVGGNSDSGRYWKGLIDDVRLYDYALTASDIEELAGIEIVTCELQEADFNYDCVIDFKDLIVMADMWLLGDYAVQASPTNESYLQAYYMFNSSSGDIALDSSGHNRNGTIEAQDLEEIWDSNGYSGNCIAFDGNFGISVPAEVFFNISNGLTISTWVNIGSDIISSTDFMAGAADPNLWDKITWDTGFVEGSNNVWMHYAFVKDATSGMMNIYYNGVLMAQSKEAVKPINGTDAGVSYIGSKSDNSGDYFIGMMDDFKIYNYAMSQAEVVYLAKGPSGQIIQPIKPVLTLVDPFDDGIINLRDFSILANQWLLDPVP